MSVTHAPRVPSESRADTGAGGLRRKVASGVAWTFGLRIASAVLSLVRVLVLARLLAPSDFGQFAIATLALGAVETLSQTGFNAALIQRKGDIKPYLHAAWTIQILRGVLLAATMYLTAPWVATYFGEPGAGRLLQAIGLATLFQGFTNTAVVQFQKDLDFRKQFSYFLSGSIAELVVGIVAAVVLRDARALVLGLVVGNGVRMVVSYLVHPFRPRPSFDVEAARSLYAFGLWMWGLGLVSFIALSADKALIGKILGATALGYYIIALRFSEITTKDLSRVINTVTFAGYAQVQDDRARLRRGFTDTLAMLILVTLPITLGLILLAPALIEGLLGPAWLPAVGALQTLSVTGFVRGLLGQCGVVFRAVGKPKVEFWSTLARAVIFAGLVLPFAERWGITGVAFATTVAIVVTAPVLFLMVFRLLGIRMRALSGATVPTFVSGAIMSAALVGFPTMPGVSPIAHLAIGVVIGSGAFLLPLLVMWWYTDRGPVTAALRFAGIDDAKARLRRMTQRLS